MKDNMKIIKEHSTKINLMYLKDVSKNIEKVMSVLDLVSTFGLTDLYDDRDEIITQVQSLNCVSRNISQAMNRLEQ
tara:strand:- start:268 stop:495 length:228 start_codon:yes stop_codon:yes gene_type:complete